MATGTRPRSKRTASQHRLERAYWVVAIRLPRGMARPRTPNRELANWRNRCEIVREITSDTTRERAIEECQKYNSTALKRRWRTWAVMVFDRGLGDFLAEANRIEKACRTEENRRDPIHIYGFRDRSDRTSFRCFASLKVTVDLCSRENLRREVLEALQKELAEVEPKIMAGALPRLRVKGGAA